MTLQISDTSGEPVATAYVYDMASGKAGTDGEVTLETDISALVPGRYLTSYSVFWVDGYGSARPLDAIRGLEIAVTSDETDIIWDRNHWGSIELPRLTVVSE